MHIATDRLIIRKFNITDADDLYEILGDAETMKYCEPAYSFERTADFLNEFCIAKNSAVAVAHRDSNKVIGYILFNAWDNLIYEMGWIFNKKFWRQGYAYEACSNVIAYAFEKLKVKKIVAETIDKSKSVGLMKKLGMSLEEIKKDATHDNDGNTADMYIYGISNGMI